MDDPLVDLSWQIDPWFTDLLSLVRSRLCFLGGICMTRLLRTIRDGCNLYEKSLAHRLISADEGCIVDYVLHSRS